MRYALLSLLLSASLGVPVVARAQASLENDEITIIRTLHDANSLGSIKRVAVFMHGDSEHDVDVLRQALAIQLQRLGYVVVHPEEIDARLSQEFDEIWNAIPDDVRSDPVKLQEHLRTAAAASTAALPSDEPSLARAVGADAYLTATALFGTITLHGQMRVRSDRFPVDGTEVVVTSLSLRLMSIREDPPRPVLEAAIGFLYGGKSPVNASAVIPMLMGAK